MSDRKVVSVTTEEESGGITATVVYDDGSSSWGRSHPATTGLFRNGEATESAAINDALKK